MLEGEMEDQIWEADWNSVSTLLLGRSLEALLGSRQRELDAVLSRTNLKSGRKSGSGLLPSTDGPLDDALLFLHKYVKDCVGRSEPMDHILVPIIESAAKLKGSKRFKQMLGIIQWLFEDDELFFAFANDLVGIITRKVDHFISLGWCTLVRGLISLEFSANRSPEILNSVTMPGKHCRLQKFLKILIVSIARLSSIMSEGSIQRDGYELPTRLAVAAADCILVLTEALTEKQPVTSMASHQDLKSQPNVKRKLVTMLPAGHSDVGDVGSSSSYGSEPIEMKQLLWEHLDEVASLVQKLQAWNRKSRPLHAKGLGQVLKWLRVFEESSQCEPDELVIKTGQSLLISCWRHYAKLLRLEDNTVYWNFMDMLGEYLGAMQIYVQEDGYGEQSDEASSVETRKFFLNCISLILGRLDSGEIELVVSENGPRILTVLFAQIRCIDGDVVEGSVDILRTIIFRRCSPAFGSKPPNFGPMEAALPLLLNLLDGRDVLARAVVSFVAEYCFLYPDQGLQEIFGRLDSKNHVQRRNAIDVLSELMSLCADSGNELPSSLRRDIAKHLLERLGDEELINRVSAAKLFSQLDPSFVLPALLKYIYSHDKRLQSASSDAVVTLLKCQKDKLDVVSVLLDCLGDFSHSSNASKVSVQEAETITSDVPPLRSGSREDIDLVLRLTPKWSASVQDWNSLIEPLMDKMFGDPSNAVLLRFLSYINEEMADLGNVVLHRILLHMCSQRDINESLISKWKAGCYTENDSIELKDMLFDRLCPLLLIRLLPLRVLDDLDSSIVYGKLARSGKYDEKDDEDCIAAFLVNRAFHLLEFEDVRKIAAELCGRLHPQVILPIIEAQMQNAVLYHDMLKIKAGLFATCSSLMIRGKCSLHHPGMAKIRKMVESILLWPPDSEEVSKAQHGCIDCLAFMVLAELQTSQHFNNSTQTMVNIIEEPIEDTGLVSSVMPVLSYVIQKLTCQQYSRSTSSSSVQYQEKPSDTLGKVDLDSLEQLPLSFRLCMANVLISTCQKLHGSEKLLFVQQIFPTLLHFVEERIAGAKLLLSLMAGEDVVVDNISGSLWEAKSLLESISMMDASSEVRRLCEKLLSCITSPLEFPILP
ncbi:uncharacterized protein LOC116255757 isoform X3 [Nymphaea colorata]|uniref:uncharacterized protein LOC116255757 isoform X3 n=1 Tax=Nymphaea colorata TaxID=210225 RepID=UPI00214E6A2B|nr:uncharacterized protein LOC116255757 isoform X3 [Nymphaea colorata]